MKERIESFKCACKGISSVASSEINFRIHLAAAAAVSAAGFYLGLSRGEWLAVLLCFGLVMSAEAFNSAVEKLTDIVSPGHSPEAGLVKDMAAGGVLLAAAAAAVAGCVVFVPKIAALLG